MLWRLVRESREHSIARLRSTAFNLSAGQASASRSHPCTGVTRSLCLRTPTLHFIAPSMTSVEWCRSLIPNPLPKLVSGERSPTTFATHYGKTSYIWSSSPFLIFIATTSLGEKRCCAGCTHVAAQSRLETSSKLPRRPDLFTRSASGCCDRRAELPPAGLTISGSQSTFRRFSSAEQASCPWS